MSGNNGLLGCFTCRKHVSNSPKRTKLKQNGENDQDDMKASSELVRCNGSYHSTKANDESAREISSLSITSQTPAFGEITTGSLGEWSNAQALDVLDASKINFVASENSSSVTKPTGVSSRSIDFNEDRLERLESLVDRLERLAGITHEANDSDAGLRSFQSLMSNILLRYMKLSTDLGSPIKKQSQRVFEAFQLVCGLIELSVAYSKPSLTVFDEYYRPLSYKLSEIADYDKNSADSLCRYGLAAVADSAVALAWCRCPTASVFVREIRDSTNAFANRIFQYCSSHHTRYAEWIRSWMSCLNTLQEVVDNHFSFGLSWNTNGPKPPLPPKLSPPLLRYTDSRAPLRTTEVYPSLNQTIFLSDVVDEKCIRMAACGDMHAALLLEIAQTRQHLRHVSQPDFI